MFENYITFKEFNGTAICGEVSLPVATECTNILGMIVYNRQPICLVSSENARNYFSCNNDGNGLERGGLVADILEALQDLDPDSPDYQTIWDRIWTDSVCRKYRNNDYTISWVWSQDFYEAPIDDLEHILRLTNVD